MKYVVHYMELVSVSRERRLSVRPSELGLLSQTSASFIDKINQQPKFSTPKTLNGGRDQGLVTN